MKRKDWPQGKDSTITSEKPLQSWKEIAIYLERGERTARRWEKSAGLPIHRLNEGRSSSVYAYPSEIETWRSAREPKVSRMHLFQWGVTAALGVLGIVLGAWFIFYGPVFNPPNPFVEAADGITIRQVWAGQQAGHSGEPSPDGKFLSFVDWTTGDLALRDLAAEENRRLTNTANWFESGEFALESVFSPDGSQIVYTWHNQDYVADLRLIRVDGSDSRILYRDDEVHSIQLVNWLPDASQILAVLRHDDGATKIALISASDGSVRMLKTVDSLLPGTMSLSPDGRFVVYDFLPQRNHPQRDISVLSMKDGREVALVSHAANDLYPVWTPRGEGIVFASDRTGTMGLWILRVADGKPEGSPQLVKPDIGRFVPMGFTQDGALYYGLETGMSDVYFIGLDLQAGKIIGEPTRVSQRFVGSNFCPDWSSDGEFLSYASRRSSVRNLNFGSSIVVRDVATGQEREIMPKLASFLLFRWSPDGRTFATRGQDANGQTGIFLIGAQTGEVTTVFHSEPDTFVGFPSWSRDGQAIFYQRYSLNENKGAFVRRDLGSGLEAELLQVRRPDYLENLVLSRDGNRLAYFSGNRETGKKAIHVLSIAAASSQELLQVQGHGFVLVGLEWTRNDKEILFVKVSGNEARAQVYELMAVPSEGGEPRKLGVFKDYVRDLRLHPDGNSLAFAMGRRTVEVWVLENFLSKAMASNMP